MPQREQKFTEDTEKEPGREPGQYNGMYYTEKKKKKKTFKVAGPSMSNVDTSLKTMEAVLQSQYSGGHGVVIVRL